MGARRHLVAQCYKRLAVLPRSARREGSRAGERNSAVGGTCEAPKTRSEARGVAAEPVPEYFARLSANYRGYKGVECLNAAIAYGSTSTSFFTFTPKYLDSLGGGLELAGLAGFSREKLELVLPPEVIPAECIQEISVKTCTIEQILEERGMDGFDCIFMDCEGHELNILQGMDFTKVKPRLIAYEHTHYPEGRSPLDELLESKGFKIQKYEFDAVASRVA